ncbi:hypothetical protein, partial [Geobacillus sp. B4113_201601]|uniref:hypothetical protein n=1 Tax=Geobacillus sp. B4113_201601 TaxID=1586290 RepID=UPI001F2572F9
SYFFLRKKGGCPKSERYANTFGTPSFLQQSWMHEVLRGNVFEVLVIKVLPVDFISCCTIQPNL